MKRVIKKTIKICVFILLACLPFVYVTQMIGIDIFLDSFENPQYYLCVQDKDNALGSYTNGDYLIIQKSSHPDFMIIESDSIIYCKNDGEIAYTKVNHINSIAAIRRYYIENQNEDTYDRLIFENQILGKIVKIMDDNIWNSISITIWEKSIHNLNPRALLINN